MNFRNLFKTRKPVIACIHLMPLPGSPRYDGKMGKVFDTALHEAELLLKHGVNGLIVENFRDKPFYPGRIPAETVASLAAVTREIVKIAPVPVGVNALRNDACAAVAIATAAEASFIRVNVHMGAVVSEQGIIEGHSHETLRLRAALRSSVLIFADVGVKHAAPLADRGLGMEAKDLTERGLVDAIIVSGEVTGAEADAGDIDLVRRHTDLPILVGSGATPDNLHKYFEKVEGFIVGSYFKRDGKGEHLVDEERVRRFARAMRQMQKGRNPEKRSRP